MRLKWLPISEPYMALHFFRTHFIADMATDQCDSHLVDEGITKAIEDIANAYTLEFEGTGPNQGDPITEFLCEVFDMSGTLVAQTPCKLPSSIATWGFQHHGCRHSFRKQV